VGIIEKEMIADYLNTPGKHQGLQQLPPHTEMKVLQCLNYAIAKALFSMHIGLKSSTQPVGLVHRARLATLSHLI